MGLLYTLIAVGSLIAQATQAAHHNVDVGKGGELKFEPETINARRGDTITYHFFAKNHSVTQSSFNEPCQPLKDGFFSAFTPNESENEPSPTTWTIRVNDTKPIWTYCGQGNHCQQGMLHAINPPPSGNTFQAFKEKAKDAPQATSPVDGLPIGGERVTKVQVGVGSDFIFSPSDINEPVGTRIRFSFNPRNHSVTQSSFHEPCKPLEDGFSSGLIPTEQSPSGMTFDIVVNDTKPIWFYCAQGQHCANGMVGSVNAPPKEGNTLEAFISRAAGAGPGQILPIAPIGGVLRANGSVIPTLLNTAVIDVAPITLDKIGHIPALGDHDDVYMPGLAGGGTIGNYSWADNISDMAVKRLHLLHFLDNILLRVLFTGTANLQPGGKWSGVYPQTIVNTVSTMAAQAWIHRATATDSLQHYKKRLLQGECKYKDPSQNPSGDDSANGGNVAGGPVNGFLGRVVTLLSLEIGLLIESTARVAHSDPWLVPCLVTSLGSKSRMAAVANLMQGHGAAAAPREVAMPADLVYAYAMQNFVESCPEDGVMDEWSDGAVKNALVVEEQERGLDGRLNSVKIKVDDLPDLPSDGRLWIAWLGPWGNLEFTLLEDGRASVPAGLYGHVWAVVTTVKDVPAGELAKHTVAGPEMLWVTQP